MAGRLGMAGRTIVVVGAGGGGIGTAVCAAVAAGGGVVVGVDVREDALPVARDAVEAAGAVFHGIVADVRDASQVEEAMTAATERTGSLDGLVNVVGGQQPHHWQPLLDLSLDAVGEVFALNLHAAFLTGRAAASRMISGGAGGAIVNVGSVAGFTATPYSAAYGMAKAALVSLTRTMAVEWGRHGIRANLVAPGTIRTPGDRAGTGDGERDRVLALKRRGTADELANAVLFALSDLSSFVTGQELLVDGGSLVRASYLDHDDLPVFMQSGEIRDRIRA